MRSRATQRPKRMLVIINPVATKMSERVRCLVVYALQGRYDVTTRADRRQGPRDRALPRGGRAGLRRRLRVRRRRHGQRGRQRPGRLATALTVLPGGSNNVVAKLLGHPDRPRRRHRAHPAARRPLGAAPVDLGMVNGRYFTFAAGMGLDASVVERVDRNPRLKKRFGPFYFVECAIVTFLRKYVVDPPRLSVAVDGREVDGVSLFIQNAENYTYFNDRPGAAGRGRAVRLRLPGRRRPDPRAALRRPDRHVPRAVGRRADRRAPRDRRVRRVPRGRRALRRRPRDPDPGRRRPHLRRARGALQRRAGRAHVVRALRARPRVVRLAPPSRVARRRALATVASPSRHLSPRAAAPDSPPRR